MTARWLTTRSGGLKSSSNNSLPKVSRRPGRIAARPASLANVTATVRRAHQMACAGQSLADAGYIFIIL